MTKRLEDMNNIMNAAKYLDKLIKEFYSQGSSLQDMMLDVLTEIETTLDDIKDEDHEEQRTIIKLYQNGLLTLDDMCSELKKLEDN